MNVAKISAFLGEMSGALKASKAATDGTNPFWPLRDAIGEMLLEEADQLVHELCKDEEPDSAPTLESPEEGHSDPVPDSGV